MPSHAQSKQAQHDPQQQQAPQKSPEECKAEFMKRLWQARQHGKVSDVATEVARIKTEASHGGAAAQALHFVIDALSPEERQACGMGGGGQTASHGPAQPSSHGPAQPSSHGPAQPSSHGPAQPSGAQGAGSATGSSHAQPQHAPSSQGAPASSAPVQAPVQAPSRSGQPSSSAQHAPQSTTPQHSPPSQAQASAQPSGPVHARPAPVQTKVDLGAHPKDAEGYNAGWEAKTAPQRPQHDAVQTGSDPYAHPAFAVFEKRIAAMLIKLGSKDEPSAVARDIWGKVWTALKTTDKGYDAVPDSQVQAGRADLGSKAYQSLLPAFDGVTASLEKYLSIQGLHARTWGFWSTPPAKELAKKHCDMALEASAMGWPFDNLNITGDWDMQMWGALSRAYARAAVTNLETKQIYGFVGPGVSEETVYERVERREIESGLTERPDIKVTFLPVATDKDKKNVDETAAGGTFAGTLKACSTHAEARSHATAHWEQKYGAKPATTPAVASAPVAAHPGAGGNNGNGSPHGGAKHP